MKTLVASALLAVGLASTALASETMSAVPAESWTLTNYYKQSVYDPKEAKIGDIDDVLVDKTGKVTGLVVGSEGSWSWRKGRDCSLYCHQDFQKERQVVAYDGRHQGRAEEWSWL